MTAPADEAWVAYGPLCGALNRGAVEAMNQLAQGFRDIMSGAHAYRRSVEAAKVQFALIAVERERCRASVAAFDVDAAHACLADLGARNAALAARWGLTLGGES